MTRIQVKDLGMNYKAKAIKADGVWYLVSYDAVVAQCDGEGNLTMHIPKDVGSNTTARHINKFVQLYAKSGTDWKKATVVVM